MLFVTVGCVVENTWTQESDILQHMSDYLSDEVREELQKMLDGPQPTGVNDPSLTNAEVNELVPESIFSGETAGKSRAFSGHLKPEEPPVPKPVKIEPCAPFAWDDDLYSVLQKASEWPEVNKRIIDCKESTAQEEAPRIKFSTVSNDAEFLEVLDKLVESSVSSNEKLESYPVNALPLSCSTLDITLYPVRLIRTNFRVRIWMQ